MKIKLIAPGANRFVDRGSSRFHFSPLGLAVIAAFTPGEHEVSIIDEAACEFILDKNDDADLVGISSFTSNVKRGYEIADFYRKINIPVVMGGQHVSALPDEALQHCDAVVVREAELIWGKVLEDCKEGRLKGIYQANEFYNMKNMPFARIDLYPKEAKYLIKPNIHVTRGCPHNCTFCSATRFAGKQYRRRPVEEVINEMKHIKKNYMQNDNRLVFNDDNFTVAKNYAKELFRGMIPLDIKWQGIAGIDIVEDDELLRLCKASGCLGMFVGFDSLSAENLKDTEKNINTRFDYIESVRKIQEEYGIPIIAALMAGFDHDTTETFEIISHFIDESRAASISFNILYPYPGTPIFDQLQKENRLTSCDWDNYVMDGINFIPAKMTQDELHEGYMEILRKYSTDEVIKKRADHALKTPMGEIGAQMIWNWGKGIQRQYNECLQGKNKIRRPKTSVAVS